MCISILRNFVLVILFFRRRQAKIARKKKRREEKLAKKQQHEQQHGHGGAHGEGHKPGHVSLRSRPEERFTEARVVMYLQHSSPKRSCVSSPALRSLRGIAPRTASTLITAVVFQTCCNFCVVSSGHLHPAPISLAKPPPPLARVFVFRRPRPPKLGRSRPWRWPWPRCPR